MSPLAYFVILLILQNGCVPVAETTETENLEDEVSLVQVKMAMQPLRKQKVAEEQKQPAREPYWPQPRGGLGHYSRTHYGLPQEVLKHGNLTDYLAFKFELPSLGLDAFLWGTLLDDEKNIYIISFNGFYKLNPDGETVWQRPDLSTQMGSMTGNSLCAMAQGSALMTCVDIASGATLWSRQVAESTGIEGDMVTSNNGVVIAAVGTLDLGFGMDGSAAERVMLQLVTNFGRTCQNAAFGTSWGSSRMRTQ